MIDALRDDALDLLGSILSARRRPASVVHSCAVVGKHSRYTEFYIDAGGRGLSSTERAQIRSVFGNAIESQAGGYTVVMVEGLYQEADEVTPPLFANPGVRAEASLAILSDWTSPGDTVVVPARPFILRGSAPSKTGKDVGCIKWAVLFLAVCAVVAGLFPSR